MYEGGHPNWWARPQNRLATLISKLHASRMVTLQVTGRRTGRTISVPLAIGDLGGERYLVSMLGPDANWVRNVRAAGGRAVLCQGRRRTAVHLEEVTGSSRALILRRYLERAPGARPHVEVERRSPLEAFERVAAHYPVFRICDAQPHLAGRPAADRRPDDRVDEVRAAVPGGTTGPTNRGGRGRRAGRG